MDAAAPNSSSKPSSKPSPETSGPRGPLAGFRVIDLTINVLGPLATQVLGDMGADVIKVEAPEGDYIRHLGPSRTPGMGAYYMMLNRNKRSISLDLKKPEAREALLRLVDGADVFVHNMRHAAAERLGASYAALCGRNPRLVYASATGFRKGSSLGDRGAFDDIIQAMSGIAGLIGQRSGTPDFVPSVICDKICGHALANAISLALLHRERTGEGQEVHVPMYDTMVAFIMIEHLMHGALDEPQKGLGYSRMLSKYRRPYATKDGHVALLPNTDPQWKRAFEVIGRPELATDPRFCGPVERAANIDDLYAALTEALTAKTSAEWLKAFEAADLPHGPSQTLQQVFADPYFEEAGFFARRQHPSEGTTVTPGIATSFSKSPGQLRRHPPRQGEHTAEILAELGYGEGAIEKILGAKATVG